MDVEKSGRIEKVNRIQRWETFLLLESKMGVAQVEIPMNVTFVNKLFGFCF